VEYFKTKTDNCGVEVAEAAIIHRNYLSGSNEVRNFDFSFLTAFCQEELCDAPGINWKINYRYKKQCAEINDEVHSGLVNAKEINQNPTFSELELLMNGNVTEGKAGALKYFFSNEFLTNPNGEIKISITLPAFLEIINTNFAIGTSIPQSNITVSGTSKIIELIYPLPLTSVNSVLNIPLIANCGDTLLLPCKDSLITSCYNICSSQNNSSIIVAEFELHLNNNCDPKGLLKSCTSTSFISDCTHGFCTQELAGYVDFDMDFKRLTVGLPDKNGDNIPDQDGILDPELLNLENVFLGDTFRLDVNGEIIVDVPGSSFKNALVQVFHEEITSASNYGVTLIEEGLKVIETRLHIWDKSTNTRYTFDSIPFIFRNVQYTYNLSTDTLRKLNPLFPSSFMYEDGDSISFSIYKVFEKNFPTPFVGWNGHELTFKYVPKLVVTNEQVLHEKFYLGCGCPDKEVTFSGFNFWSQWAIPGVGQCPGQSLSQGILLNYGYSYPSPGEVKYFVRPIGIKIGKIGNISLDSIGVSFGVIPQKFYKNLEEYNDYFYIDISDFTNKKNFRGGLRFWLYRTSESCISESVPPTFCEVLLDRSPGLSEILPEKVTYTLQNFNTVPTIELELQQKEYSALSADINIPLKLTNKVNSTVRNIYIRPVYDENSFTDITIELSGLPVLYPDISGFYVLGNMFQNEVRNLRFKAKAKDCGRKRIIFEYGYDCDVYSNPAEKPCFQKFDTLYIDFPDGELEVSIDEDDNEILLCDTLNESNILVFNGGLGSLYGIESTVVLPPGVRIIDGSCYLIFPAGSGNKIPLPLPQYISERSYSWKLKEIWPDHELYGLPPVSESPMNAFEIVYKTITNCDFISGSREKFLVIGSQICGIKSNQLVKTAGAKTVSGIETPPVVLLNVTSPDTLKCGQTENIRILYSNIHSGESSLFVELPAGLRTVAGSFTGNLPIVEPLNNQGVLQWTVPAFISNVLLSFDIISDNTSGCFKNFIDVYTSSGKDAFCVKDQVWCNIQAISSFESLPLEVIKPQITLDHADITNSSLSNEYNLNTSLSYTFANGVFNGKLYYDKNGDQNITSEDSLLTVISFDPAQSVNNIITKKVVLNLTENVDICRLFLMITEDENCICSPVIIQLNQDIQYTFDTVSICWNEMVKLGPEIKSEKLYQWNTSEGMSCTQCHQPEFLLENSEDFYAKSYTRTLIESDIFSGCKIIYTYHIEVFPKQKILSTPESICPGDSIILFTTNFSKDYLWSGQGIIWEDGNTVSIKKSEPGFIFVTMIDENLCEENDSVFINVNLIPETAFINDNTFCFGEDIVIGYVEEEGLDYRWIDDENILLNPDSSVTGVNTNSDRLVFLEISNNACKRLDSVSVILYEGVSLFGLQDTFYICKSDSLFVELSGADYYSWEDNFPGSCLNDSCSQIVFVPAVIGNLTFHFEAINNQGCKDSFLLNVISFENKIITTDAASICSGQTLEFLGQIISTPGLYCDTVFTGDCQYIQCLDVTYTPPVVSDIQNKICDGTTFDFYGSQLSFAGIYEAKFQTQGGCDSIIRLTLDILPAPDFTVPSFVEIEKGETTTIILPENYKYSWNPSSGLNCFDCSTVVITGQNEQIYTISATNEDGCVKVKTIRIVIKEKNCNLENVMIPNAFSPNGDDINDIYLISGLDECGFKITVFNRWGNIVFEQNPFENQWDGRSDNGNDLPQGTYFILLESADGIIKKTSMLDLRRE
jgi:gliding motility-associated-like protein